MMRPPRGRLLLHQRERLLRAEKRARQVDVDDRPPLLDGQVFERHAGRVDAGVVEQHVEPAEAVLRPREQRADRLRDRSHRRTTRGRSPPRRRPREPSLQRDPPAARQHDRIPFLQQRERHRLADAAARARHERHRSSLCSRLVLRLVCVAAPGPQDAAGRAIRYFHAPSRRRTTMSSPMW